MNEKTEINDISNERAILLADDNDLNRESIRRMLVKNGFSVTSVKNGKEVIATFTSSFPGEFSAILMDTTMPIFDGINAIRIIRTSSHPEAESIPIIAVSAKQSEVERKSGEAAGMSDYIVKPFDAETLVNMINRHIK
ncbi:MAG TPA: response regulator [Clostridia bacterium]|nr:response regulator [Clostridia bacterium]